MNQSDFMQEAVNEARKGLEAGKGGPFGAVVVKDGKIIGRGCNHVIANNDPTAHAEVMAIRDACRNLGSFQLDGCVVYTTCEPCPMCLGAIYWARPEKVFFASSRHDAAAAGFDDSFIYDEMNVAFDQRAIPLLHESHKEADGLFRFWSESPMKKEY